MKCFNILVVLLLSITAGKGQEPKQDTTVKQENVSQMSSFGERIVADGSISNLEMLKKYKSMGVSDSVQTKFTGVVKEVCQAKGCWMKVELQGGEEAMVRFKDYGFFVPKDIAGRKVVLNGYAFVEEMTVGDQRHYARDGGESAEEIEQITKPKKTFGFEASGVLLE